MAFVSWTPALSVGVEPIDTQHQELFHRIGALVDAMYNGVASAEVDNLLTFLEDYVHFHFGEEEEQMRRSHYPEREQHFAEHAEFIRDLAQLREEYLREGASPLFAVKVNNRVAGWLVNHVMSSDHAMGAYLRPAAAPGAVDSGEFTLPAPPSSGRA